MSNNIAAEGYNDIIELKKQDMTKKLHEYEGHFIPEIETFEYLVNKFKKSVKRNYDFLVKASKSFQTVIFKFAQLMIKKRSSLQVSKKPRSI